MKSTKTKWALATIKEPHIIMSDPIYPRKAAREAKRNHRLNHALRVVKVRQTVEIIK